MPLNFDISHFIGPKVQRLQVQNLRLQERVRELETKNAILNLRLASSQTDIEHCQEEAMNHRLDVEENVLSKNKIQLTAEETRSKVKEIKQDLNSLEEDVVFMFNDAQKIFESHIETILRRTEKVKIEDESLLELRNRVDELEVALSEANDRHTKEKTKRRQLHNTLIEIRGNIRVHCRLRPLLSFDSGDLFLSEPVQNKIGGQDIPGSELGLPGTASEQVVHAVDDENVSVTTSKPTSVPKTFEFEHVYFPGDGQEIIFEEVRPLITSLLDGYNVCIMAYGQTGSGKTHTMLGTQSEPGIVPHSATELFKLINEKPAGSVSVQVSVVEVYNNDIYDLLADNPKDTKHIVQTTEEGSLDIMSTIQIQVHNPSDIEKLMEHGLRHRAMIATKVHEHSSRSHLVVTITVTNHKIPLSSPRRQTTAGSQDNRPSSRIRRQLPQPRPPLFGTESPRQPSTPSKDSNMILTSDSFKTKLQLVDLAGSECVGMSGVTGNALRETSHINRSLSALSDVLAALSERRAHVPYRNSRLTRLLQDSIGGDAKLLLLLCVSPAQRYLTESLQCLNFGYRARQVQRGPPRKRGYHNQAASESPSRPFSPREKPSVVRGIQL